MKKILHSIVTALFLGVILSFFVPTRCFFTDDAYWTYQNDAARMDIGFVGHLKNGRVEAEGVDLRISQPTWFSRENYQGTTVEIPVSYRTKSCQIKMTPQADALGRDASLVINFMGKGLDYEGKSKPAWVCFRNIVLNGKLVTSEKRVWHDQAFRLNYPLPASEITLSFDVHKPLKASDFSFPYLLGTFLGALLLCLFLPRLKTTASCVQYFINSRDIVKVISGSYRRIDPVYRRSFWIIFGVLCFVFGFHAIQFMWGNHDWPLMLHVLRGLENIIIGRYMVHSVKVSLLHGVYLPFIYDIVVFVTLAINAVLLCKYWRLEKRVIYFVICGLVLTAQPFTLNMMYFVNMIPESFIGVTCALVALLLSERVVTGGGYITRRLIYSLLSIVLINLALAMYPPLLNTIAVAFVGRLLIQSFDWDGSLMRSKSCMRLFTISAIHIVLGIALYKFVIAYVFPIGSSYNVEILPMERVPERLCTLFTQCFHQLREYNFPFITQWILWIFLGFTILLMLHVYFTGNFGQKIVRLFLLFGSLFATQTTMIIAKVHVIEGRIELFGLVFFEVLVLTLVVTRFKMLHNLWVIVGVCIIYVSVLQDLDCLRVWKLGFDAEKMLWNRVLARLEVQKDFDPAKKYDVVQIGTSISMRPRYFAHRDRVLKSYILNCSYDPDFSVFCAHDFYYPTPFRRKGFSSGSPQPDYVSRLRDLYEAGVLQKAEVWPKANGLIVWKDTILFVTDGRELDNYRRKFERELGKK